MGITCKSTAWRRAKACNKLGKTLSASCSPNRSALNARPPASSGLRLVTTLVNLNPPGTASIVASPGSESGEQNLPARRQGQALSALYPRAGGPAARSTWSCRPPGPGTECITKLIPTASPTSLCPHDSDPVLPAMVTGWLAGPCPLARAAQLEPGPDCRAQQCCLELSALYASPLAPGRPGPWPSGQARVSCISLHTSGVHTSIQVWMYVLHNVYVSKCMSMYLHVYACICTYLHVCHIHWKYAKYNCIHDSGVWCVCIWMYVYLFKCILYVFARIMHVFVRICMYAIFTENMPSMIVYLTWALGVYVFECMCMYLYVSCTYLHVSCMYLYAYVSMPYPLKKSLVYYMIVPVYMTLGVRCVCILCILYVFACIMYVLVRNKQYLYVYVYICVCVYFL